MQGKKVALFGAGTYIDSYIKLLHYYGINKIVIADNDINKIGTIYNNITIISPEKLIDLDCQIIITCMKVDEIRAQLESYKISDRIVTILEFLELKENKTLELKKDPTIILDLYSKATWGGAENWNLNLAEELEAKNCKVQLLTNDDVILPKDYNKRNDIEVVPRANNFDKLITYYREKESCIFVNSFFDDDFFAAIVAKANASCSVEIITIVHNDFKDLYILCKQYESMIDKFICVSSIIQDKMINEYQINTEKVLYLPQPIRYEEKFKKVKRRDCITVGIASRIVKNQKRCDYIIPLIDELEQANIDYYLEIAGDGELIPQIKEYIEINELGQKVKILGFIEQNQMGNYWRDKDIFVSFSDFEGTSLSMLEAMSYGCVPLVTLVSGVNDFVIDGYNGYICTTERLESFVDRIKYLSNHKTEMVKMGESARKAVEQKCCFNTYSTQFIACIQ